MPIIITEILNLICENSNHFSEMEIANLINYSNELITFLEILA